MRPASERGRIAQRIGLGLAVLLVNIAPGLSQTPDGMEALLRAETAYHARQYALAAQWYEVAARLWPACMTQHIHARLGRAWLALQDFDRAAAHLDEALVPLLPRIVRAKFLQGDLPSRRLSGQALLPAALRSYAHQGGELACLLTWESLYRQWHKEAAKGLALLGTRREALHRVDQAWLSLGPGRYGDMVALLQQAAQRDPSLDLKPALFLAYRWQAEDCIHRGEYEKALTALNAAVPFGPAARLAQLQIRAHVLESQRLFERVADYDRAEEHLAAAEQTYEQWAATFAGQPVVAHLDTRTARMMIYQSRGLKSLVDRQWARALQDFDRFEETIEPANRQPYFGYHRGLALWMLGQEQPDQAAQRREESKAQLTRYKTDGPVEAIRKRCTALLEEIAKFERERDRQYAVAGYAQEFANARKMETESLKNELDGWTTKLERQRQVLADTVAELDRLLATREACEQALSNARNALESARRRLEQARNNRDYANQALNNARAQGASAFVIASLAAAAAAAEMAYQSALAAHSQCEEAVRSRAAELETAKRKYKDACDRMPPRVPAEVPPQHLAAIQWHILVKGVFPEKFGKPGNRPFSSREEALRETAQLQEQFDASGLTAYASVPYSTGIDPNVERHIREASPQPTENRHGARVIATLMEDLNKIAYCHQIIAYQHEQARGCLAAAQEQASSRRRMAETYDREAALVVAAIDRRLPECDPKKGFLPVDLSQRPEGVWAYKPHKETAFDLRRLQRHPFFDAANGQFRWVSTGPAVEVFLHDDFGGKSVLPVAGDVPPPVEAVPAAASAGLERADNRLPPEAVQFDLLTKTFLDRYAAELAPLQGPLLLVDRRRSPCIAHDTARLVSSVCGRPVGLTDRGPSFAPSVSLLLRPLRALHLEASAVSLTDLIARRRTGLRACPAAPFPPQSPETPPTTVDTAPGSQAAPPWPGLRDRPSLGSDLATSGSGDVLMACGMRVLDVRHSRFLPARAPGRLASIALTDEGTLYGLVGDSLMVLFDDAWLPLVRFPFLEPGTLRIAVAPDCSRMAVWGLRRGCYQQTESWLLVFNPDGKLGAAWSGKDPIHDVCLPDDQRLLVCLAGGVWQTAPDGRQWSLALREDQAGKLASLGMDRLGHLYVAGSRGLFVVEPGAAPAPLLESSEPPPACTRLRYAAGSLWVLGASPPGLWELPGALPPSSGPRSLAAAAAADREALLSVSGAKVDWTLAAFHRARSLAIRGPEEPWLRQAGYALARAGRFDLAQACLRGYGASRQSRQAPLNPTEQFLAGVLEDWLHLETEQDQSRRRWAAPH